MDVVSNNYLPGDPRLIDHIVYELKSQGIFDNFRKECIADVDTKPAYQNLRQRVEGSVIGFLKTQKWKPDMNKNHVREMLRKNISESGFLETGVERIVDQVVNPKINSIFLPQVENVVYKVLGITKPSTFDELKFHTETTQFNSDEKMDISSSNLLPSDLDAVSPESEPHEKKIDISSESQKVTDSSKIDEDESPPFEPLEESSSFMMHEENSVDSHLSGFSGLASHDSNHSFEGVNKITPMEISNQDSQFSKQSSDGRLSIVMSDETDTKLEINEDSTQSKLSKTTDSNSKNFDFVSDNPTSTDKSLDSLPKENKTDPYKKIEEKLKSDEKKDKHRSSDKHRSRHDSKSESRDRKNDKDRKSDKDKKEYKDKDKHRSRDVKDRDKDKKDYKSKSDKDDKDRERSKSTSGRSSSSKDKNSSRRDSNTKTKEKSSDSKTKEPEHKETKSKDSSSSHRESKSKDSKERKDSSRSRDDSKSKSDTKSHDSSKSRSDSKNHSKHGEKTKTDSSEVDKSSNKSSRKDEKVQKKDDNKHHSQSEKNSSNKKEEKRDKVDSKKDMKKIYKDDHYSLKGKNSNRRSTDRDSSDGHSGTNSSSSLADSSASSQLQKSSQEETGLHSRTNSGDSGNSDHVEQVVSSVSPKIQECQEEIVAQVSPIILKPIPQLSQVKLIKPKFASNIFEARRLMKIRKKLGKIEKQRQMGLINTEVALDSTIAREPDPVVTYEIVTVNNAPDAPDDENLKKKPNILKKVAATTNLQGNLLSSKLLNIKNNTQVKNKTSYRKKANAQKKISSEKSKFTIPAAKIESEEETVAEVVEVGEVSYPLQNSVISKESWDAIEAKLVENVMKAELGSHSNTIEKQQTISTKDISTPQPHNVRESMSDNGDCLYLMPGIPLETQRYLTVIGMFMDKLEESIRTQEIVLKLYNAQKQNVVGTANSTEETDGINKRLPKVAIVDVTGDSEIVISPSRGIKRPVSDNPDVHNNNKRSNRCEEDEKMNHIKVVNTPTKSTPISKVKKAKVVDSAANHLDTFNLPLSPAESDKSFTTANDKKSEKDDTRAKRNSNKAANNSCSNQRYSTDDLYKPRLQFTSSRRRAAKGPEPN